ncbi:hypothetical protein BKP45_12415 [Anaerobacillus alkalidiazotrophicus]|uniref:Uncharacterized protein n=1 Tax=Anaerobacillus alkalidiazotrophicus TaxID=472963 RepID=A0A1S2M1R8_9BACI|nr:PilN domain-containing protein [Anaerobacillus alkalidiazotrophicus]OIJ18373.1 hypothetical protein BKP45_18130 [Anaerobacillus alkalidiazotrophicus]OIJ19852.1 hypothetical protein BKP45_12415 [Anaerobacillus alkalidiazotrophicus]
MLVEINLLTEKDKKDITNWLIVTVIFVLLLVSLLFIYVHSNKYEVEIDALTDERSFVQEQISLKQQLFDDKPASYHEQLKTAIYSLEKRVIPTSMLLNEVVRLLPEHGYFSQFYFQKPDEVTIIAYFDQMSSIAAYSYELNKSPYMFSVHLTSIETAMMVGNETIVDDILPRYVASFTIKVNRSAFLVREDS